MNQWTLVNTRRSSLGIWLCLHALWLSQVGCGPSAQMAARTPPVPMVTVAEVTSERTIDFDDYVGRTEATETVSVRSRGYGYLKTVEFQDGQYVEEGQLLYSIESDDYEAAHAQSLAGIAVAESKAETAKAKVARNEQMVKVSAISREEYEESVAAVAEAEASITSAKATAVRTELDLKHTKIYAPISGQIDRTLVTPGNLVIGGLTDGTLLTRIVKTDRCMCTSKSMRTRCCVIAGTVKRILMNR